MAGVPASLDAAPLPRRRGVWLIAVSIDIALGGPTSPLHWFQIVMVALVIVVGSITEWRYRRDVGSTHRSEPEADASGTESPER